MSYETMKSFILFVLVGVSIVLSFLIWSYQPNYDSLSDTDYVNEADVGGEEKSKEDLFKPEKIIFNGETELRGFSDLKKMQDFYEDASNWVLFDYELTEATWKPKNEHYAEIIFPNLIPAELMTSLFTFEEEEVEGANWSFDRVYLILNHDSQSIEVVIKSTDDRRQLKAEIQKSDPYQRILNLMTQENKNLTEYTEFQTEHTNIYIPKESQEISRKTVIATEINSDLFINALFRNPSLVTPNVREAYFTDGQRGMQVDSDNLKLEFINPIQSNYDRLSAMELIEKSMSSINEHKGWTNNFNFNGINRISNTVSYRMMYDNYPVFNDLKLGIIEQEWRGEELYSYNRSLIKAGNVLNNVKSNLISGEKLINVIKDNKDSFKLDNIRDIRIGYYLEMLDDDRSLTLTPSWFVLYENDWVRFNADDYLDTPYEGGD